jgi:hypothetical protein
VALLVGSASQADDAAPPPQQPRSFEAPPSRDEVVSLRTESSRTYRAADGRMVARISQAPVNFRDGAGDWQPIDTALRPAGGGRLVTTAAATEVSLPVALDEPARVTKGSRWVSFALVDADGAARRTVSGSTATYAGALDGVDARYDAHPSGVKETLILADASAPSTYRFALDASAGLTPSLRGDGSIVFRDGDGTPQFWVPAPTVQDADAPVPTASHVSYRLSEDHRTLTVAVDPDWLAQAAFPVKVDPSIYTGTNNSCTLANGSLAATADCNGTSLKVGHDAGHTYRSALRFSGFDAVVPRSASIISAELHLYLESQTTGGATTRVDVTPLGNKRHRHHHLRLQRPQQGHGHLPGPRRCHRHRAEGGDDLRRGRQRSVDQDPQQFVDAAQDPHLRACHQLVNDELADPVGHRRGGQPDDLHAWRRGPPHAGQDRQRRDPGRAVGLSLRRGGQPHATVPHRRCREPGGNQLRLQHRQPAVLERPRDHARHLQLPDDDDLHRHPGRWHDVQL